MNAEPLTIRLRAGFYVTRNAQWRIVRRSVYGGAFMLWNVEHWNPLERQYNRVQQFRTLANARRFVVEQQTAQREAGE